MLIEGRKWDEEDVRPLDGEVGKPGLYYMLSGASWRWQRPKPFSVKGPVNELKKLCFQLVSTTRTER